MKYRALREINLVQRDSAANSKTNSPYTKITAMFSGYPAVRELPAVPYFGRNGKPI